jgi:hypothetical protein
MSADQEVLRLAAEVKTAWEQLGEACDALAEAEAPITAWVRDNPPPEHANGAERTAQVTALKARCPGLAEAEAGATAAGDRLHDAISALCAIPARSLRGLAAKARVARLDDYDRVAWSIVDDLLAMVEETGIAA